KGAREVQRIERPHWLDGKRPLSALRDVARHLEHGPTRRCACEGVQEHRAADLVEQALRDGSSDHPSCLDEGQLEQTTFAASHSRRWISSAWASPNSQRRTELLSA